jgi:hypothetical protein
MRLLQPVHLAVQVGSLEVCLELVMAVAMVLLLIILRVLAQLQIHPAVQACGIGNLMVDVVVEVLIQLIRLQLVVQ